MRISKIILDNFRGYKHAEIDFNRFNCIVGKNDVGKSTIFEAIKWFFDKSQNDADDNFNINQLDHEIRIYEKYDEDGNVVSSEEEYTSTIIGGNTMSVEIRFCDVKIFKDTIVYIFIDNENVEDFNYLKEVFDVKDFLNEDNELCVKKAISHSHFKPLLYDEIDVVPTYRILTKQFKFNKPISCWDKNTLLKDYASIYGKNDERLQSLLTDSKDNISVFTNDYIISIINEIRNYYSQCNNYHFNWMTFDRNRTDYLAVVPKFRYFNANTLYSEYNNVIQDYFNSFLYHQIKLDEIQNRISTEFKEINSVLNRTIKSNDKLTLVPKVTCKFNVQFEFTNGLDSINIKNKGDGIQNVLINIFFRYISNKDTGIESIFVFEEPEAHLHPEAQKDFFKSLLKLSERYNQVMITTHSPLLVSMCDTKNIIHIKKENNYPNVYQNDKLPLLEVIEDLGIGSDDMMLSIFDSYKSILFVEGKNDNYTLNKISELYKEKEKEGKIVDKTFEEMKCLIMFIGGCSTVEEWANLGIVTKLAKPFVILLDSDKKGSGHISNNQTKLDKIYKTLNNSIETNKKAKINFNKDNFITTRKRELENYIKPSVIENYYNKKNDKSIREEELEDIQDIMERIKNVELSIIAFVYKHDKSIRSFITEALKNIPIENRKEKARQIRKEKTIEILNNYIQEYQNSNPEFQCKEWLFCKVKGIDINHYTEYKDVIGKRSYIYCMEKEIDIEKYKEIYNKCKWIDTNYHYLIAYVKHKVQFGRLDITEFDSIDKFENVLNSNMKKEITQIEQAIKNTTITDVNTDFCFNKEIIDNWEYIDVPLAIYCSKEHLEYNEDLPDKKSKCESIKVDINKYFFEEGNIKFEYLDFSYGDNQDEFLDIYNRIKAFND